MRQIYIFQLFVLFCFCWFGDRWWFAIEWPNINHQPSSSSSPSNLSHNQPSSSSSDDDQPPPSPPSSHQPIPSGYEPLDG